LLHGGLLAIHLDPEVGGDTSFKMPVHFQQKTRRHFPKDSAHAVTDVCFYSGCSAVVIFRLTQQVAMKHS
jgi:hypothetical protein